MNLIEVSYYLEGSLVIQFNKKYQCSGKPERKLLGFQLQFFHFEYNAKWKTWSWKTLESDHNA